MFGQRSVVRDQRNVETQLESYRSRITESPTGDDGDVNALFACVIDCNSIALRNMTTGIEQSPVQIESEKAYPHKERTG